MLMGCVYRQAGRRIWWVKYKSGGKQHYESSNSTRKRDAVAILKLRTEDIPKRDTKSLIQMLSLIQRKLKQLKGAR
jgi:hypothetical protein